MRICYQLDNIYMRQLEWESMLSIWRPENCHTKEGIQQVFSNCELLNLCTTFAHSEQDCCYELLYFSSSEEWAFNSHKYHHDSWERTVKGVNKGSLILKHIQQQMHRQNHWRDVWLPVDFGYIFMSYKSKYKMPHKISFFLLE